MNDVALRVQQDISIVPEKQKKTLVVTTYLNYFVSNMIQQRFDHPWSLSPVLDLQQIADETIASAALNKVALSSKEFFCSVVAVLLPEVVEQ